MEDDWLEAKVARPNVGAGIYFARQRLRNLTFEAPNSNPAEHRASSFSGVSLSFLQRFAALHVTDANITTLEVVTTVIKPATEKDQCRWLHAWLTALLTGLHPMFHYRPPSDPFYPAGLMHGAFRHSQVWLQCNHSKPTRASMPC